MNNSTSKKLSTAINLSNSNKIKEADIIVNDILLSEPNNLDALNIKGIINSKSQNYNNAINYFEKGLAINPNYIPIIKNIVSVLRILKQYDKVDLYLRKLIELEKDSPPLIAEFANNLILLNQKEEALEVIESHLDKENQFEILIQAKANCLFELRKYKESKKIYKELYSINDNNFQALFKLGLLNLENKEYHESIKFFNEIIEKKEKFENMKNEIGIVFYNLGMCYEGIEELSKAEENYIQALKYNEIFLDAYVNMSNIYYFQNKLHEALDLMNKAIKINPRKRILYMNLSNIYQKFGKHQESVFCKRIAAGSIVFKCKEEYGPFEIDKVQLNEKI